MKSKLLKPKPRHAVLRNPSARSSLRITSADSDQCRIFRRLGGTDLAISRLTVDCISVGRPMYSRAEYYHPEHYRRLGLAAKQRAAQSTIPSVKEAFKDIARHWLALAERVEWLDTQLKRQENPTTIQKQKEPDDKL
jgi:hypothetical protein